MVSIDEDNKNVVTDMSRLSAVNMESLFCLLLWFWPPVIRRPFFRPVFNVVINLSHIAKRKQAA